jgi:hypothetical protein
VAWIDADLEFLNHNWVRDTVQELQTADVVRMWRSAVRPWARTVRRSRRTRVSRTCSSVAEPNGRRRTRYGFWHTGYAWACRRSAYDQMGGLVEWAILGSGDRHMAMCLAGLGKESAPGSVHENYKGLLRMYESRVKDFKVSWVDGTIIHFRHGSFADRRYKERWDILTKMSMTRRSTLSSQAPDSSNSPKRVRGLSDFWMNICWTQGWKRSMITISTISCVTPWETIRELKRSIRVRRNAHGRTL